MSTEMSIPLFHPSFGNAEKKALLGPLIDHWLTQGEVTKCFERALADKIGANHVIACSNGTAALHLAYHVADLEPGDEVLVPSLTFVATVAPLIHLGLKPVFVDVENPDVLTLDPGDAARKITERTRAIVAVHYAGVPANEGILELAAARGLLVIEDCAHALVSRWGSANCGTRGFAGCFSFFSNKNMTTGEGGAIAVNDDELADRLRLLRSHGMTTQTLDRHSGHAFSYDVTEVGYNFRIDEIRSALGLAQLERLDDFLDLRRTLRRAYVERLCGIVGLTVPWTETDDRNGYHIMVVLLPEGTDRQAVMLRMREAGIQTSIHYRPVHTFTAFASYRDTDVPVTAKVAPRLLTLPFYPTMQAEAIETVCVALEGALG